MSGLIELSADARSKTIGGNFRVRAWVNFNGTGTVAIRGSGNVSSITDNGTGDYTVNFTHAMPDSNYCISYTSNYGNTARESVRQLYQESNTYVRVLTGYSYTTPNASDVSLAAIAIFR